MRVELRREAQTPQLRLKSRFYLVLVAENGEDLAVSESYYSKFNAVRAARKNFRGVEMVDTTEKEYRKFGGL